MKRNASLAIYVCLLTLIARGQDAARAETQHWPQWRGPLCNGVAPGGNPPISWSEEENVKWKIKLPGHGNASPIVWGDKVFILAAIETDRKAEPTAEPTAEPPQASSTPQQRPAAAPHGAQPPSRRPGGSRQAGPPRRGGWGHPLVGRKPSAYYKCVVICLDRRTGNILWQQTACEAVPHESHHRDGDYASFSPVTDGKLLYAYFGSMGLYCYDLQGDRKWQRDLGKMNIVMQFGEGGSPAIHEDKLFINFDHQGDSFFIAIDKQTGKTIWKVDRDEVTSWSTPLIVDVDGQTQAIVSASGRVRGYDAGSGKVVWECGGQTRNVIPAPVSGFGMVFATSGFRGSALQAIKLGRRGDLTDSDAVSWQLDRGTPYVPSPLLYDDKLYVLDGNAAILSCYQADSGTPNFARTRLDGLSGVYASPVGAADRVYLVGRDGTAKVIKRSKQFDVLATNTLDDSFDASPAIVDDELFLRGKQYLYCIAK